MTVKNRFIHFKSKDNFLSENGVNNKIETPDSLPDVDGDVKYGNIKESSVVFIKDSKEIWTHGNLYKSVNWSVLEEKYKMVDLGLPSGLLWADRNIGASSPWDNGLYFQWGDTVGYTVEQVTNREKKFAGDWSDYFDTTDGGSTFNKYDTDKLGILQPEDDAATVNMGSDYRMPTQGNFNELINNCTATFIDINDNEFSKSEAESGSIPAYKLKGVKFTGSNGNSIFIPAAGMCSNSSFVNDHFNGHLWSSYLRSGNSTYALYLTFDFSAYIKVRNTINRYTGQPIRGVKSNN